MKSSHEIFNMDKITLSGAASSVLTKKQSINHHLITAAHHKPKSTRVQNTKRDGFSINNIDKKNTAYLQIETVRKIILQFLNVKQMTKDRLAEKLDISVKELDQILIGEVSIAFIQKINLPLIKLYCKTKWT